MQGNTIQHYIENERHLFTEDLIKHVVFQILKGLNFLRNQCVVHRDIKGENILLDKKLTETLDVVVKIGDFGLSCYCDPTKKGLNAYCGTDIFMAPEMLRLRDNPSTLNNAFKKTN